MTNIITVPVRKAGRSIDVDVSKLVNGQDIATIMAEAPKLRYVLLYGLVQSLNDAHASEKQPSDSPNPDAQRYNIMAVVQKKLDAIYSGSVMMKARSGVAASSDPVAVEARKLGRVRFNAKGKDKRDNAIKSLMAARKVDEKTAIALLVEAFAKDADIVAQATANVATNRAIVAAESGDIDIAAMFPDESSFRTVAVEGEASPEFLAKHAEQAATEIVGS